MRLVIFCTKLYSLPEKMRYIICLFFLLVLLRFSLYIAYTKVHKINLSESQNRKKINISVSTTTKSRANGSVSALVSLSLYVIVITPIG